MEASKAVKYLVLDAGPIIKNQPVVSSLLHHAENLVTVPAIISEIRDGATRSRIETTLLPFLTLRNPKPESVKLVANFARRTGDLNVLSKPDVQILALAYELECELNVGDWRLRSVPGQKRLNGAPPGKECKDVEGVIDARESETSEHETQTNEAGIESLRDGNEESNKITNADPTSTQAWEHPRDWSATVAASDDPTTKANATIKPLQSQRSTSSPATTELSNALDSLVISKSPEHQQSAATAEAEPGMDPHQEHETSGSETSDSEGWITPSNIKKQQAKDAAGSLSQSPEPKTMQVATITTDFAMQNVLLQMNLNLLSLSLQRVRHIKTFILRCHACFQQTKEMSKQFCPRCGKPSLTRVACSTDQNGEFKIHLKRNMQWNTRGDRYSIPKPVPGSSNGRVNVGGGGKGGGKGGWGQGLIFAEDQKEYVRGLEKQSRLRERDLMDEDYLPGILTGERSRAGEGGRPRIGAGRNVNSRRR